jgi:hypothetical protein
MMADAEVKPATTGTDTNSTRKPASRWYVSFKSVTYYSHISSVSLHVKWVKPDSSPSARRLKTGKAARTSLSLPFC